MNVIVTGGAGFIGTHVSRALILKGHRVLVLDNLHPYYSVERKKDHLAYIKEAGEFNFLKVDLRNETETLKSFRLFEPDAVIHLAALPGVRNSILHPQEYIDYDIKATVNVLKAAGEAGVKHVVFASSSSVYGNRHQEPMKEEMANGKVISPYAAAKYGAESFCFAYEHLYGFKVSVLRFFTVYGPWGRPDMAIAKFILKGLNSETIEVYDLNSARDYTYIDDAVDGILRVLFHSPNSNIYNIGSSLPIPLTDVVALMKQHFPDIRMIESTPKLGDVTWTWADISKVNTTVGYKPKVTFEEGFLRTVEWAKKYVQYK
ncbi:NAD-dependent epimerase/dehydratase family protein [Bacillus sp. FJAT-47783]|uniref:NAD-dependent epimerase/dehydratase family protein n=1 Tax=Bacillus sp. FJAT-47783 TaxID=2922712 RepID=UPI001FACCEB4|nr:NAD-dependent epimerase/dehydratase family protein [Bacillus sp. FJAT-47783]